MAKSGNRIGVVLTAVGIAAMAFLGVIAGNWYLADRRQRDVSGKIGRLESGTATRLSAGDSFPDLPLVDLEGKSTTSKEVLGGMPAIVVFVSINCESCTEAILAWSADARELRPDVRVVAVADNEHEYVRVYAEKTGFPFPVFCDETERFGDEFDVTVYPTAMGIDAGGRIAFVRHGFEHGYSLGSAIEELGVIGR
jgi:peroxiredoxin